VGARSSQQRGWTGVPLRALLERAELEDEACEIVLEGADRGTPKEEPIPPDPICPEPRQFSRMS
jgi:DMSO/TMAO reductase YedYZ molybdopterin-dependent catalytic subunit